MAGTTARGYPYPHDPDPINVALDIQLLAEAIDRDVQVIDNETSSGQDEAQNIAISNLQSSLTANYNQDAVDRARMEAINTALTTNTNNDAAQQNAINALQNTVNSLSGDMRAYAGNVAVTLDGQGLARIPLHNGGFPIFPNPPVVLASHNDLMGGTNGLFWLDVKVGAVGNMEFLVQVAVAQTGELFVNTSIIVSFIAVGRR